jgi:hypothetical protein
MYMSEVLLTCGMVKQFSHYGFLYLGKQDVFYPTKADMLKEYGMESLIKFLRGDSKLKHIEVGDLFMKLEEKKIISDSFLKLSGWDFKEYGMLLRQVLELEDYIKELCE